MNKRITCQCGYKIINTTVQKEVSRKHGTKKAYSYYLCVAKAQQRLNQQCAMTRTRAEIIDNAVWRWIEKLAQDPQALLADQRAAQREIEARNVHIREDIADLERQSQEQTKKINRWLELFGDEQIDKEFLYDHYEAAQRVSEDITARKAKLEAQLRNVVFTDEMIQEVAAIAAKIRKGIDHADNPTKQRGVEALNLTADLVIENGEKVLYIHWLIYKHRVSLESDISTQ
jgi:hypothetical protein